MNGTSRPDELDHGIDGGGRGLSLLKPDAPHKLWLCRRTSDTFSDMPEKAYLLLAALRDTFLGRMVLGLGVLALPARWTRFTRSRAA